MDGVRRRIATLLAGLSFWAIAGGCLASDFTLERLNGSEAVDQNQVVSGALQANFQSTSRDEIVASSDAPHWWRLVVHDSVAHMDAPQLVLSHPSRKVAELWQPGETTPIRRTSHDVGRGGGLLRYHVFPLVPGLKAGDVLYLRVSAPTWTPSEVSIVPLEEVHLSELRFARYRTAVLVALAMTSLLAFGFFVALSERGYAYLGLTLLAQLAKLMIDGGEIAIWPWLAEVAVDRRTNILISTAAVLAGLRFVVFFLCLPQQQPRIARALTVCSAMLGGLLLLSLVQVWPASAYFGNTTMLIAFLLVAVAGVRALRRRLREAFYLLLAWAPVMAVLVATVGGYQGWWPMHEWIEPALPAGLASGGIGLLLGLTDRLHQLRKDRDAAQLRWKTDRLTGAITRDAVEEMLNERIQRSFSLGVPLSVIFIDIDRFKEINDQHGHAVGDAAIRIVAARARNWLQAEHLIARFGGDEMLVVLYGCGMAETYDLADKLRLAVTEHPLAIDKVKLRVSLSMGVSELQEGDTVQSLLQKADVALYQSKEGGRSRVTGFVAEVSRIASSGAEVNP